MAIHVDIIATDENGEPLEGVIIRAFSNTYKHRDKVSGLDGKLKLSFVKEDQTVQVIYGEETQTFFPNSKIPKQTQITQPHPSGQGSQIIGTEPARVFFNRISNVTTESASQNAHTDTWSTGQEANSTTASTPINTLENSSSKSTIIFGGLAFLGAIAMYLIKKKKK